MQAKQVNWERRRVNLRALIAVLGTNPTHLALTAGLSANTISKFTNGATPTLSQKSADRIAPYLGIRNLTDLDTDTPIGDTKNAIRDIVERLPDSTALELLAELKARF